MKKLFLFITLLTLSAGLWAQTQSVNYIDANGVEQTVTATVVTNEASTLSAGWYVVTDSNVQTGTLVCNGAVHLILADGAKLTATGNDDNKTPGIQVSGDGNSLAVYGQSAQSGQLEAIGRKWAAGIGGGWHANHFGNGSNITINGGIVTATGGQYAAGIGGGLAGTSGGLGSYITINGGVVTATGECAGIGAGNLGSCSNINITGGKVTANGGTGAAGIGVGESLLVGASVSCSNINITGGEVTANGGGMNASGIGGGRDASVSNITIAATLLVKADDNNPPTTVIPNTGADLASSLNGKQYVTTEPIIITYGEYITVSPEFESGDNVAYGTYTFTAADRWADNYEFLGFYKESTFNTPITEGVSGYVYTLTVNEAAISVYAKYRQHFSVPYIDADGQEQTAAGAIEITTGTLSAGWYVVRGSDENHGQLTCNGAVHIILADGAKLTANGWYEVPGITVSGEGNSLTIYGQTNQSGQLIAQGGFQGAGIGGGVNGSGSNITINGGTVTAKGGEYAAGIGGGSDASGSNITINGGTVTASGGNYAAGIGGGSNASGSNITINGGTVTANGGGNAAGIGGGSNASGSNITINGGKVTATGGVSGAGVGGGFAGSGSNITINGGTVTANAGENASCIGRGDLWHGNYGSNIFVAVELVVRADNSNPPQTVVAADRTAETDIAGDLDGKRYATVRIPQPCIVTYGDYITVSPQFASGGTVAVGTEITFTAADRFADNYEFLGFYKESTFENKITNGVSGLTYTATVLDDDISVYAKYEEFIPTPYIDADGQEQSVKTTEITNETSTLNAGWYVVFGNDVHTGTLTCNGAVNLILADGAKLTATGGNNQAGITVSGGGNSLTIYGQTAQSGQLFATGGYEGAGIGGGKYGSGSNITVNGGTVTANGGDSGAGIGGGWHGSGSNIIINGGNVIANGGGDASVYCGAGIGGGYEGSGWSIKVATALTVYADNNNPPMAVIIHTDNSDIAGYTSRRYVIVKDVTIGVKEPAIAAINAAIEGVTNADIIAIANNAIAAINAATNVDVINAIKEQALAAIASAKAIYNSALGEMGVPCDDCPSVEVTGQSDNTIKLYNPKSVTFKKE